MEEGGVVLVREGELVEASVDLVLAAGSRTLPLDLMSRSALAAVGREGRRSIARQLDCFVHKMPTKLKQSLLAGLSAVAMASGMRNSYNLVGVTPSNHDKIAIG